MKQLSTLAFALIILCTSAMAQAPNISYTPAANSLSVGVPFSLSPTNTGGSVPAVVYGQVTTFAGSTTGAPGYTDATGTAARFHDMEAIAGDASGNIYVAEYFNNVIRKITPSGVVTTFAGSTAGNNGFVDATGTAARFDGPDGIAIDASGNIFVGDYNNNAIRKITPAGVVTTFVSLVTGASGLSFDSSGNLWAAEQDANQVIKISPAGVVTSIAGSNNSGYVNATGSTARFFSPNDVQYDSTSGNTFVADYLNNSIRMVTPAGVVTTFAGSNVAGNTGSFADGTGTTARFSNPTGVFSGAGGIIYVGDLRNSVIRQILPNGVVTTIAGSAGQSGTTDGAGAAARFAHPVDLYIDGTGTGYIIDGANNNIRKILLTGYGINAPLPAGLTFDSTTGIISGTPTAAFTSTSYTITAYNTSGFSTTVVTLSCINNWVGLTSDFSSGANWSLGHVPAPDEVVEIGVAPYSGSSQPTLSSNFTVGSIIFGANNTPGLTINSGQTLTVSNGLTVNSSSTASINGPGNINLGGTTVINPTGSLTAALNAVITLAASSAINNNGTFTLASDANGSASIAALPASAVISGNVSVQRYITGGVGFRGYRLLSSPVYGSTVGGNNVYSINYLLNSTFLTGTGGVAGGFNQAGNPTLYLYRENMTPLNSSFTNSNYRGIANISAAPDYTLDTDGGPFNIPVGNGYLFFFRGDKTTVNPYTSSTVPIASTLTSTGTLNRGTITVKDWFNPSSATLSFTASSPVGIMGYNLIGNPYPSAIDWDQFSSTSSSNPIYGPNVGNYIAMLCPNGSYGVYQAGSGGAGATNGATHIIPSGAGFFVTANNTSASLTFTEAAKTSAQVTGANLFMGAPPINASTVNQYLRLQMALDTFYNEDVLIRFNSSASTTFDAKTDAPYKLGFNKVSLSSLSSDRVHLAINNQPLPKLQSGVIGLNANVAESGTYKFKMKELVGVPKLFDVWLKDAYKKDSVDMRATNSYSFNIDINDVTSFGDKRFSLVIRQNPLYAYQLLEFTAYKEFNAQLVQVIWNTKNEENYTNFTVERSIDNGKTFEVLSGVKADARGTYSFADKNPVIGQNLYRLKQEDINNTISYSKVVGVFYSDLANKAFTDRLSIFPNPVNGNINLAIAAQSDISTSYKIRFVNSSGVVVKEITSSQPVWQGNVGSFQPGTYFVRVFNNKSQTQVGQTRFVKL